MTLARIAVLVIVERKKESYQTPIEFCNNSETTIEDTLLDT